MSTVVNVRRVSVSVSMTNFNVSDLVPPANAEDTFENSRPYIECLQSFYMTTVWSSCLAIVNEDRDTINIRGGGCNFDRCRKVAV